MAVGMKLRSGKVLRNYPKKKKKSEFTKAVTAIAKKAVMTEAETKTGVIIYSGLFGTNGYFSSNLWSSIAQGTAQQNRVGDEIRALGVRVRGHVQIDPAIITANRELVGYRLLIVAGKRPLTVADMPSFRGATDPEVLTVLSDRYYKYSSTNFANFLNRYIKFNRVIKYTSGNVTKNELYMFFIPGPLGTGITLNTGYALSLEAQVYYKDV